MGLFLAVAVTVHLPPEPRGHGHRVMAPASQIAAAKEGMPELLSWWHRREAQVGASMSPAALGQHVAFLPKPKAKEITILPLHYEMSHCVLWL